jgi:hypothetical protein
LDVSGEEKIVMLQVREIVYMRRRLNLLRTHLSENRDALKWLIGQAMVYRIRQWATTLCSNIHIMLCVPEQPGS